MSSVPHTPWLLFDYGEVLCLAPSDDERRGLEELVATYPTSHALWDRYWLERPAYDLGAVTTGEYWSRVLGTSLDSAHLDELHDHDVAMWSHPNPQTLEFVSRAHDAGYRLALLSNAPAPFGDAFDTMSWLEVFEPRVFSGRLGVAKPTPQIFRECLDLMKASASEVTFIDDREENVRAAEVLGFSTLHFEDASQLSRLLD